MVYGQTEVTRDLMAARAECDAATIYGVSDVTINEAKAIDRRSLLSAMAKTAALSATLSPAATASRRVPPEHPGRVLKEHESVLAVWLARAVGRYATGEPELIYAHHERGLCSVVSDH